MSDYKVLFLDIDGTIIMPDDTIEDTTINAIRQVQEKGIEVFLATGRPLHEIRELAKELNVHSLIGYNGAFAIYQGKDLFQEPMNKESVKQFIDIAKKNQHELVLYTKDQNIFSDIETDGVKEFIEKFHLHKNDSYSPSNDYEVLGMTLINLKTKDTALYKHEDQIHLSQVNLEGMLHCYDVIRDQVNKGIGVQYVLKHLGLKKENAIAFGDGMNDKEMLLSVGEGFAMGNGHPDLFQYAKHRTTSVTESGIYNGLKALGIIE
ncbi:HAD family phosphatase [Bacillus sp. EB106-08-02-XG196]|uniref:Cof-type HAD-IIB family hydrolase n=1 Tax=Bacillus sp. EB106-08-02-XG196 TaxID=2737049 RepID=UPI0015C4875C|nr:HAD family hydrolase [Bacillus sp. EB106-08-02-XG196]NWQ42016.1 HAD family phosphatase [Bacillus sp. EB106-08-02-XG196]